MAAFIKFDGVDGESVDKDHEKWCDLLSFSQAIHQPGGASTGTARRRGNVVLEDITCDKLLDKAGPKLAEAVCNGKVYPKVEIEMSSQVSDSGRSTFFRYELKNVLITSYNVSGIGQSEEPPSEQFSLNFEEIKTTYTEYGEDGKKGGKVEYSWKVGPGQS